MVKREGRKRDGKLLIIEIVENFNKRVFWLLLESRGFPKGSS